LPSRQAAGKSRKTAESAGDGVNSCSGLPFVIGLMTGDDMTIADITLAIFGLCNTFRVLAYVPQIVKAATDKDGAKAISLATWALFLASHLSAAAYASINANDWTLAGVFLSNAVGAGAILITAAIKRWQYKTREEVELGSRMTRLAPHLAKRWEAICWQAPALGVTTTYRLLAEAQRR
jgi:hypothetical protein